MLPQEEFFEEWLNGTLHDLAPAEIMYRQDWIESIKSGLLQDQIPQEQKVKILATLQEEIEEWKKLLF